MLERWCQENTYRQPPVDTLRSCEAGVGHDCRVKVRPGIASCCLGSPFVQTVDLASTALSEPRFSWLRVGKKALPWFSPPESRHSGRPLLSSFHADLLAQSQRVPFQDAGQEELGPLDREGTWVL